jgi:hypothetical protein
MITTKSIPAKCPGAKKKYDDKSVLFHYQHVEELYPLLGTFVVHNIKGKLFVDIEYLGFLPPFWKARSQGYIFHLSQFHVASIIAANDSTVPADFEVQLPLLSHYDDISKNASHLK